MLELTEAMHRVTTTMRTLTVVNVAVASGALLAAIASVVVAVVSSS